MDFTYEDTYAPYERIAAESGRGHGSAGLAELTVGNAGFADVTGTASRQVSPASGQGPLAGVVAGFLAAAVALGVAILAAALVRPQASPVVAVSDALQQLAVEKFGENDRNLLLFGAYAAIALLAMMIGVVAWRQVWVGVLGIGLFGLLGAYVTVTRPGGHATDAIPSIVGGVAAMAALAVLVRAGTRWTGYETPAYEARDYESAAYETPAYETPAYETPAYETVTYGTPAYETPSYETASYETPGYGTPSYETPGYETASYETPGYEFSAHETPAYEPAAYRTTGWTS
jgi:hypothetical protein